VRTIVSLLLLSALVVISAQQSRGQSRLALGLEIVGEERLTVTPGEVVTLVFRVSNDGDRQLMVDPFFDLPEGWFAVRPSTQLEVPARARSVGFLSFRPPSTAGAGEYAVGVRLGSGAMSIQANVAVLVEAVERLSVRVSPEAGFVVAGNQHQLAIEVGNLGNTPALVDLKVRVTPSTVIQIDVESLELVPGEEGFVIATIETPEGPNQGLSYAAYVSASIRGHPDSFAAASAAFRVIPLWADASRARESVPMTMTLQSVGDELGSARQVGLSGKIPFRAGLLDVNVLYDRSNLTPLFGGRDRYQVSYLTQNLSVRLFDHFQALSPLTTSGQLGSGLGGEYRSGRFRFRGMAQTTRHMFPQQSLVGTSLGVSLTPSSTTSYNILYRTGLYDGTVATLRHEQVLAGGRSQIDLECGIDSGGGVSSPSCQAAASGTLGKVGFQTRVLRTADSYPGSSTDALEGAARLKYRLTRGASLEGSFLKRTYDISAGFARETSRYLVGTEFSGRLGPGRGFTNARLVRESQTYSTPQTSIDREEDWLQMQAGYQVRPFGLSASLDLGRTRSLSNNYNGSALRSRLTARAQPLRRLSIWATGEYASGYLVNSTSDMQRWLLSVRSNLQIGRTQLSATVYHNRINTVSSQGSTTFKSLLRHSLPSGHEISFQIQRAVLTGFGNSVSTDYRLAYLQPLGLPIGARPSAESLLEGRIYDADTGEGLKSVLLFLGDAAAISGGDGGFRIPTVPGTTDYLRVDQKSVGFGRVSLVPLPLEVGPEQGRSGVLDIPVRRASELIGSVDLYGSASGQQLLGEPSVQPERLSGLGGLILELRSSASRYRTRTAVDGSFHFRGVIPESYQLEVLSSIPRRHRTEMDSTSIELLPGQTARRIVRVVPTRPAIQMMLTQPSLSLEIPPAVDSQVDPVAAQTPESLRLEWTSAQEARLYTLVVGSTPEAEIAEINRKRYETLELPSAVLVQEIDGVTWYRTALGQFRSADESDQVRKARASDLPEGTWVLRLPRQQ
jgi:hypothetical protein